MGQQNGFDVAWRVAHPEQVAQAVRAGIDNEHVRARHHRHAGPGAFWIGQGATRAAQGDVFIFVDADTLVHEALVCLALQALREGAVGGGTVLRFDGAMPLYARVMVPLVLKLLQVSRMAAGCFMFCTRTAFEAVGGFDETYFAAEELGLSQALKKEGKFVILREPVLTSGRKLRTHSPREMLALFGHLIRGGLGAVKQRHGLELWYAKRREDPHQDG